jgi:hypothetical protein
MGRDGGCNASKGEVGKVQMKEMGLAAGGAEQNWFS